MNQQQQMVKLKCDNCEKWFERKFRSRKNCEKPNYCTKKCYGETLRTPVPVRHCAWCGGKFQTREPSQRFCCQPCANEQRKVDTAKRRVPKPVKAVETIKDLRSRLGRTSFQGHIRRNARTVYEKSGLPWKCCVCGYERGLDVAHIRAVGDFPGTATIAEVNDLDNLMVMDKLCHWEYDNGFLLIDWEAY